MLPGLTGCVDASAVSSSGSPNIEISSLRLTLLSQAPPRGVRISETAFET
jgi:hypothetical protein